MKRMLAAAVALVFTGSAFAAESLQVQKVTDLQSSRPASVKPIEKGIRISYKGYTRLDSKKKIAIDLKKKYQISMECRLAPGAKNSAHFYFAPVCFGKDGKVLDPAPQRPVAGSDTVLAAPAAKGAKVIKVKDGSKWQLRWGYVAFDTKAKYADLPNNNLVAIASIKKNGNVWEIALKAPLAKAYPAGASVRNHRSGATYRYVFYGTPKAEWQKISRVFQGAKAEDAPGYTSTWRIGTAKAGLVLFCVNKPIDMEIRNLSITEVK